MGSRTVEEAEGEGGSGAGGGDDDDGQVEHVVTLGIRSVEKKLDQDTRDLFVNSILPARRHQFARCSGIYRHRPCMQKNDGWVSVHRIRGKRDGKK